MTTMLASAVESCGNAWWKLALNYAGGKGRIYTQEEDQFILFMTYKLGYGNWELLKQEIRRSWQFRFDWFLKSRTPQELARRCDTLIKMLEKVRRETPTRISLTHDPPTLYRRTASRPSVRAAAKRAAHLFLSRLTPREHAPQTTAIMAQAP